MLRPCGVKRPKKLKKRPRIEEEIEGEAFESKKKKAEAIKEERDGADDQKDSLDENEKKADDAIDQIPGIPIVPLSQELQKKPGVIFVLERASLELARVGKNYEILNPDDHANFLRKRNCDPAKYRPDIVYQALLAILDSPLNKAGMIQALYVRTEKGVLFEVKPNVHLPRTFNRFCGLMSQLLQKHSIAAPGKRGKLLAEIKNPVTRYFPVNSRRIGLSHSSQKMVQMRDYVAAASDDVNLVFVVGAMAHGKINNDYTDDFISISEYKLSAACCIGRICNALEQKWKIL